MKFECNAIPLAIAHIANSLTPNRIFLPVLWSGANTPSPPAAFVEPDKSADPPIQFGSVSFKCLITAPDEFLVASFTFKSRFSEMCFSARNSFNASEAFQFAKA